MPRWALLRLNLLPQPSGIYLRLLAGVLMVVILAWNNALSAQTHTTLVSLDTQAYTSDCPHCHASEHDTLQQHCQTNCCFACYALNPEPLRPINSLTPLAFNRLSPLKPSALYPTQTPPPKH